MDRFHGHIVRRLAAMFVLIAGPFLWGWSGPSQNNAMLQIWAQPIGVTVPQVSPRQGIKEEPSEDVAVESPLQVAAGADATGTEGQYLFSCNVSGGTEPFSFQWDLGDGTTTDQSSYYYHSYAGPGTYHWHLQVTDTTGATASAGGTIRYMLPLSIAASASPDWGTSPLTVSFVAQVVGGSTPYTVQWDFGDGSPVATGTPSEHTYVAAWLYGWKVHVIDGDGAEAITEGTISVGIPVIAAVSASAKPPYGLTVSGQGFSQGCSILINGIAVPKTVFRSVTTLIGKGGHNLHNMLPPGESVAVQVLDPVVGLPSQPYAFTP